MGELDMDQKRVLHLLEDAADQLARMLITVELGVDEDYELPQILKPKWTKLQKHLRTLLSSGYEVPRKWLQVVFSRVPVPYAQDEHYAKLSLDAFRRVEEDLHGVKLNYQAWSEVCDDMLAEIAIVKARCDTPSDGETSLKQNEAAAHNSEELPEVNMALNQVRWKGHCHPLSGEAARLLNALVKAKGEYVASGKIVSKPERVYRSLPSELQAIVEQTRKGYRLKLPS